MQQKISYLLLGLLVLSFSACTDIKKHFPDKEKSYQLTTEIPDLNIPPDLSGIAVVDSAKQIDRSPAIIEPQAPTTDTNSVDVDTDELVGDESGIDEIDDEAEEDETENELVYIELVEFSGGATRIRVESSFTKIWRIVGKGISRHSLEILDRNEADKNYTIKYDADYEKVKDGSLWDEAVFIFGSDPANEETYNIKIIVNGPLIEIIVLDKDKKPDSKGAGLKLLKLLYNSMKVDLNGALE